ncbi:tRNA uridine-5-carboxymethylaminomethyl(34) synthesis GTPase MnmE [Parvularcula dongshanensis]|uniref:tRNA modification GTPase MnmE n=1 Tax=Parvularcula dongshanensis TaxID=1173995 RepID=A0A840I1T7_9PROT|nr:tRNA modification GTPase [Parvularcula dongshanensis]
MSHRTTIFARSSGGGRAGVALFRISGPSAGEVLDRFCGGRGEPRQARLVSVRLDDGSLLDQGLAIWFPSPASFTGEDVVELHLHGSPAVERRLFEALTEAGLVAAAAGEFTLRAFEAGKLDLAQAEGLADLLEAETEAQRRQALGQLGGRLSKQANDWRAELIKALAFLEAAIDFPDEEDIPQEIAERAMPTLENVLDAMQRAVAASSAGRAIREGTTVAITGPPNVGKSSILNRLAGEDRAIVSERAGTTRDVVAVRLSIADRLVTLLDTAGIHETEDEIEQIGIARAKTAANQADLRIVVADATNPSLARITQAPMTLFVANKIDGRKERLPEGWVGVSATTGAGWAQFEHCLEALLQGEGGASVLTRDRHVELVRGAVAVLERCVAHAHVEPEILANEVSRTLRRLDELVGLVTPDEVLGEIFSSFCIGK